MMTEDKGKQLAANYLKAELRKQGLTYNNLADKLTAAGLPVTAETLKSRVNRGSFTAGFLIACYDCLGKKSFTWE